METNWIVIAIVFVCIIPLIAFFIIRNLKDKNDLIAALIAQEQLKALCNHKEEEEEEEV